MEAHPALQEVLCGPILGPKLQALAPWVKGSVGASFGRKNVVAPKGCDPVLEYVWSLLCRCLCCRMGSGSRGQGWNLWMVAGGSLRISSTKRIPIQVKDYTASTPTIRALNGGEGSPLGWLIAVRSAIHPRPWVPGCSSLSSSPLSRW